MSGEIDLSLRWQVECGDALAVLARLPDACVQVCVTSPPYFGLRDYGVDGQIGLEPTPAEYVSRLVDVFREVRRVLRDDGTLWLNLGDSYAGGGGGNYGTGVSNRIEGQHITNIRNRPAWLEGAGVKAKDLLGIPWMVAFALRADGWYLRSDCIWHKPNPMPESVTDRPTKAHEYLFLLSKSSTYRYDAEAVAEPVEWTQVGRVRADVVGGVSHVERGQHSKGGTYRGSSFNRGKTAVNGNGRTQPDDKRSDPVGLSGLRNRRSVWRVATEPFPGAHFAVMPTALVEPCIRAGAPQGSLVLDPFTGSGTVGVVALREGCRFVGSELNRAYVALARERIGREAAQGVLPLAGGA